jgi:hypothetical protein
MLRARRSQDQFSMRPLSCLNLHNLSSHTMALGSTQPVTEMSTKNLAGVKGGQHVRPTVSDRPVSRL